jgi:diacylglycerol kinase (ATP)
MNPGFLFRSKRAQKGRFKVFVQGKTMIAHAILGAGAHEKDLRLLRSPALIVHASRQFACADNAELLIIFGGDGTIHHFLPELVRSQKPVLIVPCGSGNDLARALGIRSRADAANLVGNFIEGTSSIGYIDIGVVTDSTGKQTFFCCTAGVGLDAIAAQFANGMPRALRARGGYLIAAMAGVLKNPKLQLTVSAETGSDAQTFELAACLFTAANTPSFGGGLRIAPSARLDDGQLDCILADAMTKPRLVRASMSLFRSTHLDLPEVHFMRLPSLHIESKPRARVYADGEFVCETPCHLHVAPRALCVLARRSERPIEK